MWVRVSPENKRIVRLFFISGLLIQKQKKSEIMSLYPSLEDMVVDQALQEHFCFVK